jgi:hypothetical protein
MTRASASFRRCICLDGFIASAEMKQIAALRRPDGRIADPAGRAPEWD